MKITPGKYLYNDENGALCGPGDNFVLPLWEYIEMNLQAQSIDESELISLFDITPTALNNWKKGTREISKDKLVVLCNMFGVTLDEMIEREFNDDYQYEYLYGLKKYSEEKKYKSFSTRDLEWLFERINEAVWYFEYYPLGYIPLDIGPDDPEGFPDKHYIGDDEVKYYCETLDINISYSTKTNNAYIKSVSYNELKKIARQLWDEWKEDAINHITAKADDKYKRIVLLSENIEFFKKYIENNTTLKNEYLAYWIKLKESNLKFDEDNLMAKVLLANDAMVEKNGKSDINATHDLYKIIMKHDINKEDK